MLLQVMMSLSGLLKYFGSKRVMLLFLAQAPLVWLSAMYAPVSVLEKDPVALVTIFIAAVAACAHVYSLVGYTVEASLSCKPWARWQLAGSDGGEARCPFARDAKPPSHRCPDCGSLVSEAAWHEKDSSTRLPLGSFEPMAHKLRQAVSAPELRQPLTAGVLGKEETWPLHVSQDVSNSIDLIGNYAFDGLPACCIGCATQRRCWGGLHHMAFISIIVAVIIVLFPHMLPKVEENDSTVSFLHGVNFRGVCGHGGLALASGAVAYVTDSVLTTLRLFDTYPHLEGVGGAPPPLQGRLRKLAERLGSSRLALFFTRIPATVEEDAVAADRLRQVLAQRKGAADSEPALPARAPAQAVPPPRTG